MIKEAILLAGGLGTRLRAAVPELPKCLAPVRGRPFIAYVTDYFRQQGIERFIFALGYKSDYFDDFFRTEFPDGGYTVSLEDAPLGTGGAIRQACGLSVEKTVLIVEAPNAANRNLELGSRNIEGLELVAGNEVHAYHLLRYDRVIFSHPAIEKLQRTLKDTLPKRQRKAAEAGEGKKASAAPRKRVRPEKAAEVA